MSSRSRRTRREWLAATPLALFAATGCHSRRGRILGVVPMGRSHLYWQSIHAGANAAAQGTDCTVEWNGPATETDFNGEMQIVDAMINKRVDGIAVAPIDSRSMVSVVERASREGIPVVIFDSGIETDQYVSYIATDNAQGGAMAADRVAQLLDGKGEVAIVASQPGSASSVLRETGFEAHMREAYPGIRVADKRFGMADFAQSLKVAENMLTAYPNLGAIFASNESGTVGATQALKGRTGSKVKLVGFDFSPALLEDLRAGVIDSLVVQNPFQIGFQAVKALRAALDKQPVEKKRALPPRLILKEDLDKPEVREQLHPDLKRYLGA